MRVYEGVNRNLLKSGLISRIKGTVEKRPSDLKGSDKKKGKVSGLKNLVEGSSPWGSPSGEHGLSIFPCKSHPSF